MSKNWSKYRFTVKSSLLAKYKTNIKVKSRKDIWSGQEDLNSQKVASLLSFFVLIPIMKMQQRERQTNKGHESPPSFEHSEKTNMTGDPQNVKTSHCGTG